MLYSVYKQISRCFSGRLLGSLLHKMEAYLRNLCTEYLWDFNDRNKILTFRRQQNGFTDHGVVHIWLTYLLFASRIDFVSESDTQIFPKAFLHISSRLSRHSFNSQNFSNQSVCMLSLTEPRSFSSRARKPWIIHLANKTHFSIEVNIGMTVFTSPAHVDPGLLLRSTNT